MININEMKINYLNKFKYLKEIIFQKYHFIINYKTNFNKFKTKNRKVR
jgi:hypothetical protein